MGKLVKNLLERVTKLSKKNGFPLILRILGLMSFILIISALYFGSINLLGIQFTSKSTMFLLWVLWWPFLYITTFFFARLWCGFICPARLANDLGNKIGRKKYINYRRWGFLPFVIFFLVVYLEQVSGLFLSTSTSLWFLILFFFLAFFMGLLFSRSSFCRLICPIGTLLGVFSRLSFIGLRTKKKICEVCPKKFCLIGRRTPACPMFNGVPVISSNSNCILCTNCIKNCPYGSPKIGLVKPGKEIINKAGFYLPESLFIVSLFALALVLTNTGTAFIRIISSYFFDLSGPALRGSDFVISLILFLSMFTILGVISSNILKIKLKSFLTQSGYYYLPAIFWIMFYTIVLGFLGPSINLTDQTSLIIKYSLLIVGIVWSAFLIVIIKLPKKSSQSPVCQGTVKFIHLLFLALISIIWAFILIPGQSADSFDNVTYLHPGDILEMEAFSMGFTPNTIIAEVGTEILINLDNIDIIHAFDLDEFDVHELLPGGEVTQVHFTPTKGGEFTYYCDIPGHTEAGMKGTLIVVENLEEIII